MANERESAVGFVQELVAECRKNSFSEVRLFTVFDRVCRDGTVDLLREVAHFLPELEVVWAPENTCIVDAYLRGYRAALDWGADWVLEIDAGYSHLPGEVHRLFNRMEGQDCVFGSRFCPGGRIVDSRLGRRVISRGGGLLANLLLGTFLADMTSGYELFRREALESILARGIRSRTPFFQTEIKAWAHEFRMAEVPITYCHANHSVGSSTLRRSLRELWEFRKVYRAARRA